MCISFVERAYIRVLLFAAFESPERFGRRVYLIKSYREHINLPNAIKRPCRKEPSIRFVSLAMQTHYMRMCK